jgi:hypothetical protein
MHYNITSKTKEAIMSSFKKIVKKFNETVFFQKKPLDPNPKKEKRRFRWSILLLLILICFESVLLPSILVASFINRNTTAHMLFSVDMDVDWNSKTEYKWIETEYDTTQVNKEWSDYFSEMFIEEYCEGFYTYRLLAFIKDQTGIDDEEVTNILLISSFNAYTDDFIIMQAGYLVGDNMIPEPSYNYLQEYLSKAIKLTNNETLINWYQENEVVLVSSLVDAMSRSNDYLISKMTGEDSVFKESVLTLKIMNLFIVCYFLLAIIVIISFIMIVVTRNKKTWILLSIGAFFSAICNIIVYYDLPKISLVVLGTAYAPSAVMVADAFNVMVVFTLALLVTGAVFLGCHFTQKKSLKTVIKNKKR